MGDDMPPTPRPMANFISSAELAGEGNDVYTTMSQLRRDRFEYRQAMDPMTSRTLSWQVSSLVLGAVLMLAGCGPADDENEKPTRTATSHAGLAADVPSGFNPCNDVPRGVLDSEKLRQKIPNDSNANGGVKWRGCMWVQPNGYAASIQTTNITVDMVRKKKFPDSREFMIGARHAISARQVDDHPEAACTVNVEMKSGSLEFNLTNPASNKATGHLNTCDLARGLAEKVAPAMPAST
ncbi:DUF3558 domain-containing protein [Nocardia sp. XZ_19_369]|uniref:DUF3558 domain-containing protein n=1 Tax=Nocardia sp. XZ_19_369 TaxID=2769487 RepID=UPI001E571389|nr:DUF3558 domain-containing protein [Nocardia sp. XZ_19_369]